ncbi:FAD-dependent oxidoreductase [Defluviimonas sp. 20V17]|uniref:FAD-dependent oxidoreductase n=1 Tax=Allgaiera indica TaxID=765699 RepID=A0AAN4ZY21_9RHOB|nr:NAD(P)/FAD-dependent oxidoreductase [Allgaiera indica]KDB03986.1 FAD-dependent oxidoreductase [Defluviimonas sp. 20V17]GHD99387.1 FAD-dependent oxidoreductase [Allgaiera indica]SDW27266.1 putative flavoprotein involved in K+ transport [Allgaiera indica]
MEWIDTLVVGGGQAGIAISMHLNGHGVPHLVLEKDRIAERWRTGRWDSMVANGPAWHDRFPDQPYTGTAADDFPAKEDVADYLEAYAGRNRAPIRCGITATRARRRDGASGFHVETSAGAVEAQRLVVATGAFQCPHIPPLIPAEAGLTQIHSAAYRNPGVLPEGAVLVIGAGASGVQIAEELAASGRRVYLSVGPHDRPPRRYRGRDFVWWLGVLGKWDLPPAPEGSEHVTIAVSGAHGGETVDFRRLAARGLTLVGRSEGYADGRLRFAPDLARNIARGDAQYLELLDEADAYIARNGLDLPPEPAARQIPPDPDCMTRPLAELDLAGAGVTTVIWATGYRQDFGWLDIDGAVDTRGRALHHRGVGQVPGLYFLGLPWLTGRKSSFIWGVWQDALYLAEHIATQRGYLAYRPGQDRPADGPADGPPDGSVKGN